MKKKRKFTGTRRNCSLCNKTKAIDCFRTRKDGDGWAVRCKRCERLSIDRSKARERNRRYFLKHPAFRMWCCAKYRAKKYNYEFNLEQDDIVIPAVCPVLGIPLVRGRGLKNRDNTPSLDRIDPSRGYVRGNVRVISFFANTLKNKATPEQLILVGKDAECCLRYLQEHKASL